MARQTQSDRTRATAGIRRRQTRAQHTHVAWSVSASVGVGGRALAEHSLLLSNIIVLSHLRRGLCCGLLSISHTPIVISDHGSRYLISTFRLHISGPPTIRVHYRRVHGPTSAAIQGCSIIATNCEQVMTDFFDRIIISDIGKYRISPKRIPCHHPQEYPTILSYSAK